MVPHDSKSDLPLCPLSSRFLKNPKISIFLIILSLIRTYCLYFCIKLICTVFPAVAFHILLSTKPYVQELVIRPMLEDLQETLEKTENHLLVPTLVNSLALISEQQPRLFEPRFQVTTFKPNYVLYNMFFSEKCNELFCPLQKKTILC